MTLKQLKIHFAEQLQGKYPDSEIHSFFYLLTEVYLNMNRLQIAMDPTIMVEEPKMKRFQNAMGRLLQYEPIQYILGNAYFYGLDFKVTPDVLIPRPETEELVAWILDDLQKSGTSFSGKVLDIGTGSGCIAISLAKHLPEAQVFALDISSAALNVAQQNAVHNEVEIKFMESNILQSENLQQTFDIIVSNPPYVRQLEKAQMRQNVLDHEPGSALYVEDDAALIFYRKIAELAQKHLAKSGSVYVECNQYLGKETDRIFSEKGFDTELRKDMYGNDRMLKGIKTLR